MIFLVKVSGESLWPELAPGKRYLAASFGKLRVGDYLVFKNPDNPRQTFVKKITAIRGDMYEVAGTVPWANSSKKFGLISQTLILGKIILKNWSF